MHSILGVVSVFVFEFSAVNVLLPLLPEQTFHLIFCESKEWLDMPLRKKHLRPSGEVIPCVGRKLEWRKQEMRADGLPLAASPAHFIRV